MIFRPPSGTPAEPLAGRPLRILRLMLGLRATTASYNQFSLPVRDRQKIAICTYFETELSVPKEISLFEGDGTLRGFFRALKAAMAAGEYDVVHAHSPHVGCFYLMATLLRKGARRSTVCTVHTSYPNVKFRNRLLMIPVFAAFARLVCCGRASYQSLPPLLKWLAGRRLSFVPNGVDIGRIDRALETDGAPTNDDDFTVVSVARLITVKNPRTLLQAFGRADDRKSRLTFLGDGLLAESLADDIKAYGIERRVELAGLVARETVYQRLRRADLFVSASRVEGLPIAVLEAMACRCPVVLSDIPPHREIAAGADFIPLVGVDDVEGFARAIRTFRQMSSSERSTIGEQCRRVVLERFSLPGMHRSYEAIYRTILDANASHSPYRAAPCKSN